MLEKNKESIYKNGQSRDTGNMGDTGQRHTKHENTSQHKKLKR